LPSPTTANEHNPAWAPEGGVIAYDWDGGTDTDIRVQPYNFSIRETHLNPGHDRDPDWQPVTTAQVRPKGASPMYLPLTVAFKDCGAGPTHDPPFNTATCGPAQAGSDQLTAGEPLVNGKPANLVGSIKIKTTSPSNGQVTVNITDVRCKTLFANGCPTMLGDYTNTVRLGLQIQITDRATAAGTAATIPLAILSANVPCTATADPNIGSTCQLTTDLNTIQPGAVVSGKRASWVLRKATIYDPASNEFLVPGTFYP
jgi:hypothetical protein